MDLNERNEMDEGPRPGDGRFERLFACAPVGLAALDRRGCLVEVNAALSGLLGYTEAELLGRSLGELIQPGDPFPTGDLEELLEGEEWRGREARFVRGDGKVIRVELRVARCDESPAASGLVVQFADVTESEKHRRALEEAKEKAEAASQAKSRFLAGVSHEIRTPLHAVIGMTELVLDSDLDPEQAGYLRTARDAAQSLLSVINDILDFSKIEAGKLAIDRVGFHLRSCLRDVVASLSAEARKRALRLEWEVDPAVPDALVGDPGRLRQILVNLLGNALRFTETGSVSVGVEVSAEDESCVTVHFRVTDTGIGIPESKQAEIFQAFSQVDTSTTRKYGGTGLGLSISSELVSLLGGDIWLDSRPGEGSTFHFTARFGRADPVRREPTSDVPSLRGLRALVVGRGPAGGPSPARLLERWDLDTAEVPDGDEAIRRLEESRAGGQPFDVTVCESDLASVDGFELARAVQATPGLTRAFVLVTSAGQRGDAERSRELGIAAYLARPFEPEDLFEAIVAALESSPEASPLVTRHLLRERRRRLKVLLAEDNALAIELAVTLLERWGHSVVVVRTGRAAVDALEEGRFDLVLMDMEMPEMGGVEATRTIRQREERRERRDGRTPILAMTANAFEEDADACLEAGMDGVLCKPVRPVDLERAIEDVAGRVEPPSSSEGEPAGAGDALPADLEAARQALGTYAPTLPRLLAVALGEIPKQLRRLRAAVESRDPEAVRRTAHSLKGTGAQFFAARVVERAADLEAMGRDGRLDGAPGKFRELAEELERFETYVTEKLGK